MVYPRYESRGEGKIYDLFTYFFDENKVRFILEVIWMLALTLRG